MKAISFWAKLHPRTTWFLIVIIKILLAGLALITAKLLSAFEINLSTDSLYLTAIIIIITAFLYPARNKKFPGRYYYQKLCDLIIIVSTFIGIMAFSNYNRSLPGYISPVMASSRIIPPTAKQILASLQYRDKSTLTRTEKRILKKEFFKQIKIYAGAKLMRDEEKAGNAGLVILTIIGALGLAVLLSALVCNLSCSGNDAAAIIVAVLGFAAIIWLSVVLIRRINKAPPKK